MIERMLLLESALDRLPDGIALLDREGALVFWNQAAAGITGYAAGELLEQPVPEPLLPLQRSSGEEAGNGERGALVQIRHKLGHAVPVIARLLPLQNALAERLGAAAVFHPAARLDALPHGEIDQEEAVVASQTDLEERLQAEFEDFERGGQELGLLWVAVDQGAGLRRSHGAAACQAMEEKMRRSLAAGLRPAEELGRWGEEEFLILAHERTAEMLATHARTLAGLARTSDFRWWGDRLSLTVSIGAAQAETGEALSQLVARARAAMEASLRDGGNRVTLAPRPFTADRHAGHRSGALA